MLTLIAWDVIIQQEFLYWHKWSHKSTVISLIQVFCDRCSTGWPCCCPWRCATMSTCLTYVDLNIHLVYKICNNLSVTELRIGVHIRTKYVRLFSGRWENWAISNIYQIWGQKVEITMTMIHCYNKDQSQTALFSKLCIYVYVSHWLIG